MATSTLLIGLLCLATGLVIGFVMARTLHPKERERKELEEKLLQSQNQIKDYQQEVTEHFIKTSELVNNLSHSYRDVHEHLATSAMRLTNPEISRQMIDAGFGRGEDQHVIASETPEPPKDYAPKVPGGVLSEEYGLKDDTHQGSSHTSTHNAHATNHSKPQQANIPNVNVANDADNLVDDDEDPTLKVS